MMGIKGIGPNNSSRRLCVLCVNPFAFFAFSSCASLARSLRWGGGKFFPIVGKRAEIFSNHWKNRVGFSNHWKKVFQSLEKMAGVFQPLEKKFPIIGKFRGGMVGGGVMDRRLA
jgi:hypothetical protein